MTEDKNTQSETESVEFPLNKQLLEESSKINEERNVIKERIKKIESSKSEVSESVFQRVHTDYMKQLDENTNALLEKKQDIDRELATLYEAKKKVGGNVNTYKEQLEEINFRHQLGEYADEKFHKLADEQNEKLGKFQKILAAIESNIGQYEALLKDEKELAEKKEEPEKAPTPPPPSIEPEGDTQAAVQAEPEEEYEVGGEEGYFGAETDEIEVGDEIAPETAAHEITQITEEEKAEGILAKLTIVEGDNKGEEYELTGEEFTIGRASSNTVVLKEAKVSRQHAIIKKQGTEYLVEDLHSSNGVFVNDEKVMEHALSSGDTIRIGDFEMKFVC